MKKICALIAFTPSLAFAQTFYQAWNVLNLFAGVLLAASLVFFGGGFVLYLARLGRTYRSEGLDLMQWGVSMLFVFLVISTISRWLLLYPWAFPWAAAMFIFVFFLVYIAPHLLDGGGEGHDEKKKER